MTAIKPESSLVGPNEQTVIDTYAHRQGERLVRLVLPGHYADGRLLRERYDEATNTWKDLPIPRPA